MIIIKDGSVFSSEGLWIRRRGSDIYFERGMILPSDKESDYEESEDRPIYTKDEYDAKVAEMVRSRYSANEEFALQRKAIAVAVYDDRATMDRSHIIAEFQEYNDFVEDCKSKLVTYK